MKNFLSDLDISSSVLERLAERKTAKTNLKQYLLHGCPNFLTMYQFAESILGEKFISPEKIDKHPGMHYDSAALEHYSETLPSKDSLTEIAKSGKYILLPGPPKVISFAEVPVYGKKLEEAEIQYGQKWSTENAYPGWICWSYKYNEHDRLNWGEQQKVIGKVKTYIPNITVTAWSLHILKSVLKNIYLPSDYIRTRTIRTGSEYDCPIMLSLSNGLNVYTDDNCYSDTRGVAKVLRSFN
jgi:hypothetical protein